MLSCNSLGNLGRLANQMFQYASLKGIAIHHGYEFCIPPKEIFGTIDLMVNKDMNLYDIFDIQNKNNIQLTENIIFEEKTFNFDENLFFNCPDNVDLKGYYQTEKYFKHIENQIREDFTFKDELNLDCNNFIDSLNDEVISLHIRRGDYMIDQNHPVQSLKYYQKALDMLPKNLPVLVFSDDFDWCSNQKLFDNDRFMISQKSSVDADLCMMSMCDYHIIANSSLSWWGSWLAKSKKTIAPKNWFSGNCKNNDTKDLYFANCTSI
jgi:hypothetical protein